MAISVMMKNHYPENLICDIVEWNEDILRKVLKNRTPKDLALCLDKMLKTLPIRNKNFFELRYKKGKQYKELEKIFNVSTAMLQEIRRKSLIFLRHPNRFKILYNREDIIVTKKGKEIFPMYDTFLYKLDLAQGTFNILAKEGLFDREDFEEKKDIDFLKIRNFGKKRYVDLKQKLHKVGIEIDESIKRDENGE